MRGEVFASLPLLCVCEENQLRLLEPESYLYTKGDWSLLDFAVELPQFEIRESERVFEVFLQGRSKVADYFYWLWQKTRKAKTFTNNSISFFIRNTHGLQR